MNKQLKCNVESCYFTGDNYVSFGSKLITICAIHYNQIRRIGEQLEEYTNSEKNEPKKRIRFQGIGYSDLKALVQKNLS